MKCLVTNTALIRFIIRMCAHVYSQMIQETHLPIYTTVILSIIMYNSLLFIYLCGRPPTLTWDKQRMGINYNSVKEILVHTPQSQIDYFVLFNSFQLEQYRLMSIFYFLIIFVLDFKHNANCLRMFFIILDRKYKTTKRSRERLCPFRCTPRLVLQRRTRQLQTDPFRIIQNAIYVHYLSQISQLYMLLI